MSWKTESIIFLMRTGRFDPRSLLHVHFQTGPRYHKADLYAVRTRPSLFLPLFLKQHNSWLWHRAEENSVHCPDPTTDTEILQGNTGKCVITQSFHVPTTIFLI